MKKLSVIKVLLFIVLFFIQFIGFSQERYLKMTHIEKGKVEEIHEGQRVRIQTHKDRFFRGNLAFENDSVALINGVAIPLTDIKELKRINQKRQLLGVGVLATIVLAELYIIKNVSESETFTEIFFWTLSAVVVPAVPGTIGTILIVVQKRYDLKDDWKMELGIKRIPT